MGWYDKVSGVSVVRTDAHTVDRGRWRVHVGADNVQSGLVSTPDRYDTVYPGDPEPPWLRVRQNVVRGSVKNVVSKATSPEYHRRSRMNFIEPYITTHSQTPIFCIVSRVDKRYIFNTPDIRCLGCYRAHASVNTTTPKIRSQARHCRNMPGIRRRYMPWK